MTYDVERHHRRSIRLRGYDYTQPAAYFITVCTHDRICLFGDVVEGQMRLNACGRIVLGRWRALPRHCARMRLDAFVVMPNHVHGILVIKPHPHDPAPSASTHRRGDASTRAAPPASTDDNGSKGGDKGDGRGEASDGPGRTVLSANIGAGIAGGAALADASPLPRGPDHPTGTVPGSLGAFIQNFKSTTTRKINRLRGTPGAPVWQRGYWDRILRDERAWHAVRRYIEQNPARWAEDRINPLSR